MGNKSIYQRKTQEKSEEVKIPSSENISKNQRRSSVSKRILVYDYESNEGLFEYNPNNETLTEVKDPILVNFFSSRAKYSAVCAFDNFIYTFGGEINNKITDKCFMLDLLENKSQEINPMRKTLQYLVAVKLNECIYVVGYDDGWNFCERYNLMTKSWLNIFSFEYFHYNNFLLSADDRLCLIGLTHLHWYNRRNCLWNKGDPLPDYLQMKFLLSATYVNGQIFLVSRDSNDVYCFDVKMKTWKTFSPPEDSLNYFSSITCLKKSDSVEFFIGGEVKSFIFKPPNCWKSISSVPFYKPRVISFGE